MKMDGYIRVSRVQGREGESYISPSVQEAKIRGWAELHDVELGIVLQEEDVSGSKRPDERELEQLLQRCERGESTGIIAYRLDRFSRSARDTLEAVARLEAAGGRLVGVDDGVDSRSPSGELVITVLAGLAREQWKRYKANWDSARARAIERGVHVSPKAPFGYKHDDDHRLVPDPKNAPILRDLFQMRMSGRSLQEITLELRKRTKEPWSRGTVVEFFRCRTYLGEVRHGDFVNEDAHEPLVTLAEFEAASVAKSVRPASQNYSDSALLVGLVRCAGCGFKMTVSKSKDSLRYYCKNHHAEDCPSRALVRCHKLDEYVERLFLEAIQGDNRIKRAVEAASFVTDAQATLDEAERELAAFVEGASFLDAKLFQKGAEARQAKVELAKLELSDARGDSTITGPLTDGNLLDAWPTLSVDEKRRLLAAFVDFVRVRKARTSSKFETLDGRVQLIREGVVVYPVDAGVPVS